MKIEPLYKFSLYVYLWGAVSGLVSGLVASQFDSGWIAGAFLFFFTDRFVRLFMKELPEEIGDDDRALLKKAFWSWLVVWVYFTVLVYTLAVNFQPEFYSNNSYLYNVTNNISGVVS